MVRVRVDILAGGASAKGRLCRLVTWSSSFVVVVIVFVIVFVVVAKVREQAYAGAKSGEDYQ